MMVSTWYSCLSVIYHLSIQENNANSTPPIYQQSHILCRETHTHTHTGIRGGAAILKFVGALEVGREQRNMRILFLVVDGQILVA